MLNQSRSIAPLLALLLPVGAYGCVATDATDPMSTADPSEQMCIDASQHLAECLGTTPEPREAGAPCDLDQANDVLMLSCDELSLRLSDAKSDFFDNGLAGAGCSLGLYFLCDIPMCLPEEDEPAVQELDTELPDDASECARAALEYEGCGACEYYQCREATDNCGADGYLLGFAGRYCDRYRLVTEPNASPEGQAWLLKVRRCLITALDAEAPPGTACDEIGRTGFTTHTECYLDSGFCDLPFTDWMRILNTVHPKDTRFREMFVTGTSCLAEWLSE